jgi:hypothetical protein
MLTLMRYTGCTINFFDFVRPISPSQMIWTIVDSRQVSFYLTYAELYGFVSATTKWEIGNLVYYSNAQSLSLTVNTRLPRCSSICILMQNSSSG